MERDEIKLRINDSLNECLGNIYDALGIRSGDITPFQALEWNDCVESVADLFEKLIELNEN